MNLLNFKSISRCISAFINSLYKDQAFNCFIHFYKRNVFLPCTAFKQSWQVMVSSRPAPSEEKILLALVEVAGTDKYFLCTVQCKMLGCSCHSYSSKLFPEIKCMFPEQGHQQQYCPYKRFSERSKGARKLGGDSHPPH